VKKNKKGLSRSQKKYLRKLKAERELKLKATSLESQDNFKDPGASQTDQGEPKSQTPPGAGDSNTTEIPLTWVNWKGNFRTGGYDRTLPLAVGNVPESLKKNWASMLYRGTHLWSSSKLPYEDFYLHPPRVIFMSGAPYWAGYSRREKKIYISEELVFNFPWFVVEEFYKHEALHHMMYSIAMNGGYDRSGLHTQMFEDFGLRLGIHPFYLTDTVENMVLTPNPEVKFFSYPVEPEAQNVLSKVKKLLRLSNSKVAAESEAALAAVARIMAKHNIKAIEEKNQKSSYGRRSIELKRVRLSDRINQIALILNNHFCVVPIYSTSYNAIRDRMEKNLIICGRPENLVFAEYIFHFLMERTETLWQEYHRTSRPLTMSARYSFQGSLLVGFDQKLRQAAKASENSHLTGGAENYSALMEIKDPGLKDYVNTVFSRLTNTRRQGFNPSDALSANAGYAYGKSLNINRPLEAGDEAPGQDEGKRYLMP
jgi:hypothetical protein